jgi:purine nucleoside phosphorylase
MGGNRPVSTNEADIAAAAAYLSRSVPYRVSLGIVLGSGLGGVREAFRTVRAFPYRDIPHFPVASVEGHKGELVLASRGDVRAWIMDGRVHLYEGHTYHRVTFPARVLARLGVTTMIITNAAGAVNPDLSPGDIMLIEDHINLMWTVVPEVGGGPQVMHRPYYSKRMLDLAESVARCAACSQRALLRNPCGGRIRSQDRRGCCYNVDGARGDRMSPAGCYGLGDVAGDQPGGPAQGGPR